MFSGVVQQMDCIVHAVLVFWLGTGDGSGGRISSGAVLVEQRNSIVTISVDIIILKILEK